MCGVMNWNAGQWLISFLLLGPAGREAECITESPSSRAQFKIWRGQEVQKVQER